MRKLVIILLALSPTFFAAEDNAFATDQSLLAVFRVPSLRETDANLTRTLQIINPFYKTTTPFLSIFSRLIYNEKLSSVRTEQWMEAVRFALPLEKNNDWVYVYNVTDERKYVADLLGLGNMRQEGQEKGLTRYRRTNESEHSVFYLGFITENDHRLAILSTNFQAAERARAVYLSNIANGLLVNNQNDLAFTFHAARFHLTSSQILSQFFTVWQQDLVVELAGLTAKPDNALVIALSALLNSLQRLVRELAIINLAVKLDEQQTLINGSTMLQYGGSLHYAVSAAKTAANPLAKVLPPAAEFIYTAVLWNEISGQVLSGLAGAVQAFLPKANTANVIAPAQKWYDDFTNVDLQCTAGGVVDGAERVCGPVVVSLSKWGKAAALPALWQDFIALIQDSALAEILSERGIKLEIITDPTPEMINGKWAVYRTQITPLTQNFTLPGILAETQRYLTVLAGDTLIIVTPSAPLDTEQYRVAEKYLLSVLTATLNHLEKPTANPLLTATANNAPETFFCVAGNLLKFIQLSLHSQAIWSQKGALDSLPIPWTTYADEFKNFPTLSEPAMLSLSVVRNQLNFNLKVNNNSLTELVAAILNCRRKTPAPLNDDQ